VSVQVAVAAIGGIGKKTPDRRHPATAYAATMNIYSVTRVASVANTVMPMAGKMKM
jgi:hypothetical protein